MADRSEIYLSLDEKLQQIRLLTLSSGHCDEPLHCSLSVVSLLDRPQYNALSYVWGDIAPSAPSEPSIILDKHVFPVTPNLYSALHHLRPRPLGASQDPIVMWIDALCINQEDLDERNRQVAMMRDIYASATEVTIWLGEADEDSDATFDDLPTLLDSSISDKRTDIQRHAGNMFYAFMSTRTWFTRVWILQELAMARDDPFVLCGYKQTQWSSLMKAWHVVARDLLSFIGTRLRPDEAAEGEITEGEEKTELLAMTKLDVLDSLRPHHKAHTGASLVKLLYISRSSAATDPRDRIYGLLGLLDKALERESCVRISVEYGKSCAEVYTDAMAYIFSRGEGPNFLSGQFLSGGSIPAPRIPSLPISTKQPQLPSWVPDFSRQSFVAGTQTSGMTFLPPAGMSVSGAGQGAKNGKVLEDHRTLRVEGLVVDTIDEVIPLGVTFEALVDSLTQLENVASQARQRILHFDDSISPHMRRYRDAEPLWRILISNKDAKSGYATAPASYEDSYLSLRDSAKSASRPVAHLDDAIRPHLELALLSCVGRKSLFITDSGFIGTCVPACRKGDLVAIIFGSPAPFVLRPLPLLNNEERLHHSLIGTCYVGGIMGGVMVDELYCEDLMDSTTFFIQ